MKYQLCAETCAGASQGWGCAASTVVPSTRPMSWCDSTAGTLLWFSVWPMSLVLAPQTAGVQCNIQLLISCPKSAASTIGICLFEHNSPARESGGGVCKCILVAALAVLSSSQRLTACCRCCCMCAFVQVGGACCCDRFPPPVTVPVVQQHLRHLELGVLHGSHGAHTHI